VVSDVAGARSRGGRRRIDPNRTDRAPHDVPRAGDTELLEEKLELRLQRVANRLARALGEIPDLLLVGPDRLLAGLVEELLRRLPLLALRRGVLVEPALDLALQRVGERGVVVDRVHEVGGEVDLRAVVVGEVTEVLRRKGRGSVLDRPGEAVLFPRDPG